MFRGHHFTGDPTHPKKMKMEYLGIESCESCEVPISGIYMNEVSYMTIQNAASIANADDVKGIDLLKRIRKTSFDELVDTLYSDMGILPDTTNIQRGYPTESLVSGSCTIKLEKRSKDVLKNLWVYGIEIHPTECCVLNMNVNGVSSTHKVDGISFISINKTFDTDVTIRVETNCTLYKYSTGCACIPHSCIQNDIESSGCNSFTIVANYKCDLKKSFVFIPEQFGRLLLYKSAINFIHECNNSQRNNTVFRSLEEKLPELVDFYQKKYDVQYKLVLNTLTEMIRKIRTDCFPCTSKSKLITNVL